MRFRNIKTGDIIDVPTEIKGDKWEKVDGGVKPTVIPASAEEVKKPVKKRTPRK